MQYITMPIPYHSRHHMDFGPFKSQSESIKPSVCSNSYYIDHQEPHTQHRLLYRSITLTHLEPIVMLLARLNGVFAYTLLCSLDSLLSAVIWHWSHTIHKQIATEPTSRDANVA
eukprot:420519_1